MQHKGNRHVVLRGNNRSPCEWIEQTMRNAAILVVETEALIRMESADIVRDAGFTALEARNVDEAVRMLATRSEIRAVFVETKMSGSIDGLTLAHVIRDRWP